MYFSQHAEMSLCNITIHANLLLNYLLNKLTVRCRLIVLNILLVFETIDYTSILFFTHLTTLVWVSVSLVLASVSVSLSYGLTKLPVNHLLFVTRGN